MANTTHTVPAGPLEVDPAWLRFLNPSEPIDTRMGVDTMLSRTGRELSFGASYPSKRLDIIHHIYLLLLDGKLFRAPVRDDIQRILDVGTGTGIWAIDVAESFPTAEVVGTDLSPIQPSWVPPNVSFQIDDAESVWTFSRDSFDLIHIRHLNGGIKDWGKLIGQAFTALKPGGWIDIAEYEFILKSDDGTLSPESNLAKYYRLVNEAADKLGQEFKIASSLDRFILDAGFDKVHHEETKIPLGTWPAEKKQKEMGAFLLLTTENAFEAFGMALLTRSLGMGIPEVEELITAAKRESRSKKTHTYSSQHLYYAQKPFKKADPE
ncbi:S-adenosyl-L-methionine-dependent methyltransferase [Tuber magnatum]|uniref:S-adenosyl-L-methionine-dependent methyltransferase n=1 Tax=Tuber magnatum TaxID=42249 RepID=A0A317SQZ8_9PEZI|nr:S-adenosyl-L-methionine-dependent methyltransferase [Tuber magnatum]